MIRSAPGLPVIVAVVGLWMPQLPDSRGLSSERIAALLKAGEELQAEEAARRLLAGLPAGADLQRADALDLLVESLIRTGRFDDPATRQMASEAVRLREATLGADHPDLIRSLARLGQVILLTDAKHYLFFSAETIDSTPYFERAYRLATLHRPGSLDFGLAAAGYGRALWQEPEERRRAEFQRRTRHSWGVSRVTPPPYNATEAAHWQVGEEVALEGLAVIESVAPHSWEAVDALLDLERLYFRWGNRDRARASQHAEKALEHGKTAVEIAEGLNPEAALTAAALFREADARHALESRGGAGAAAFEAARPGWQAAVDIFRRVNPLFASEILMFRFMDLQLDREAKEDAYRQAKSIIDSLAGASSVPHFYYLNLAMGAGQLQDLASSIYYNQLALASIAPGSEFGDVRIQLLQPLSSQFAQLGDRESALRYQEEILDQTIRLYGEVHPQVAMALSNLGATLNVAGRHAEARSYLERSIAMAEANGASAPTALNNLGVALSNLGELDEAENAYRKAGSLGNLGRLAHDRGRLEEAGDYLRRDFQHLLEQRGPEHPSLQRAQESLSHHLAEVGQLDEALRLARQAHEKEVLRISFEVGSMPERQALESLAGTPRHLSLILTLASSPGALTETVQLAWDMLIQDRARILEQMAVRQAQVLGGSHDPEARQAVESARRNLANLVYGGSRRFPPAELSRRIDEARRVKEEAEWRLAASLPPLERSLEAGRLRAEQLPARLAPGTALVAFARYPRHNLVPGEPSAGAHWQGVDSYVALVAVGGAELQAVHLGSADSIDQLTGETLQLLLSGRAQAAGTEDPRAEAEYREAAGRLRSRIWDPLNEALKGARRVFIVPDGDLHRIPFGALPTGRGYLVEDFQALSYLSSERDLAAPPIRQRNGLLALGNPLFRDSGPSVDSRRSGCGDFASLRFGRLPHTEGEVREIARLWQADHRRVEPVVLVGAAATEAALKRRAGGQRLLHLATHGFFLGSQCSDDVGGSRGVGGLIKPGSRLPGPENPLLRAGLALAGANARAGGGSEDGILTAEEIASLDLRGVELVVLSACDTGRGEIRSGEGVLGLRSAFRQAGARSIVMTLWSVDDEQARLWMSSFYRAFLEEELRPDRAAQRASIGLLRRFREAGGSTHPHGWAAFTVVGAPSSN